MSGQYGVRFHDASVLAPWNGRTQEQRAREELARLRAKYPRDNITLVWRASRDDPWQAVDIRFTPEQREAWDRVNDTLMKYGDGPIYREAWAAWLRTSSVTDTGRS